MDPNHHIEEYLSYYLSLKNEPEYAVLLRGKWGAGKSWFINNFIKNYDFKFIYVSLNGITSYKDIEESFFQQLHPILASKGMKTAGKLLKGLIKTTIKVDLDNDGQNDGSITAGLPNDIELPSYFKNLQERILIFDDLERCPMEIDKILGYITQYIEHHGLKVIVIANENEIIRKYELKKEDEKNENKYLRIKEKLIGRSFDIGSDFDNAISVFKQELSASDVKKLIDKYDSLIKELFQVAGYNNLRHLKQSILDLERFYGFLPAKAQKRGDVLNHILQLFFAISFELRKGQISEEDIPNLFLTDALAREEGKEKTPVQKIRDKYSILGQYYHPFDYHYWFQYFKFGFIEKESFEVSIFNSIYFQEENTPDWMKLWGFYNLNDNEFEKISKKVFRDFKEYKIEDKYTLIQVTGILLALSKKKLIASEPEKIIELGKKNIESLKSRRLLKLKQHGVFPSTSSHGLSYQSYGEPDFMEFWKFAKEEATKARIEDLPAEGNKLLATMKLSMKDFYEKLTINNSNNSIYYDIPILQYISIKDFTDAFLELSSVDKRLFGELLEKRYTHSGFSSSLVEEMEWLEKLKIEIERRLPNIKGKISKILIEENTIYWLNKSIEELKNIA